MGAKSIGSYLEDTKVYMKHSYTQTLCGIIELQIRFDK